MNGRTLPLVLYRLASHAVAPALPLLFRTRLKRGKEDPAQGLVRLTGLTG